MADDISPLTEDDWAHLDERREWVRGHYVFGQEHKYDSTFGKLSLLSTILENHWVEPHETWKLQSLGVTFGDVLAERCALTWAIIDDEYGRSPCLLLPGTSIRIFPVTAISKRIERGDSVDVDKLCLDFARMVYDMKSREPFRH